MFIVIHRNIIFILTLYTMTLQNSLILVAFFFRLFGSSMQMIMLSKNTFLFPLFYFVYFLFCFVFIVFEMNRACNTMLNRSGQSRSPCLAPDLIGESILSPLNMKSALDFFLHVIYKFEGVAFYPKFFEGFYHECVLDFFKNFLYLLKLSF